MTTGFQIGGVDEFDTLFEPYTSPYSNGSNTGYLVGSSDLRLRYLRFSALQNFPINTSGTSQITQAVVESTTTDYLVSNTDLKYIFAAKGSVKYGIVIPVSSNVANLDTTTYINNYLSANFPSIYNSNLTYFNANYNPGAGFSASNPGITLYIPSNVIVYSNNSSLPAMTISALPSGVTLKILNYGYIAGAYGVGGYGGSGSNAGGNGQTGGTAIALNANATIDNTNGHIYGGGGGGGGGGPAICQFSTEQLM